MVRSSARNLFVCATVIAATAVVGAQNAAAQTAKHPFGLGLAFGDPAGFTGKVWLNRGDALQFSAGYRAQRYYYHRIDRGFGPLFTLDWVHHFAPFGPKHRKVWFRMHVGVGGALGLVEADCFRDTFGQSYCVDDPTLATLARAPVGFDVYLRAVRFEFFVELAPSLMFFPEFRPTAMGRLGARFYF